MATPRQGRPGGTRPGGGKTRDKGTRGGRPEPQPAGTAGQGNGQRSNGQQRGSQATRPVRQGQAAVPATPATRAVPLWFQLTTWVLALAGLGVSIYLTIAHYGSSAILVCSEKGLINCAAVTTSPESMVFVLYLVYTELITLNAICLWCTSVHVITFLLFGLIVFSAAAGYGLPETTRR